MERDNGVTYTGLGYYFEMTKPQFLRFLKTINSVEIRFEYSKDGNDEWNLCGTARRQATYEFYVIVGNTKKMIVYKQHRRTHDLVQQELEKKYNGWAQIYIKQITNYEQR